MVPRPQEIRVRCVCHSKQQQCRGVSIGHVSFDQPFMDLLYSTVTTYCPMLVCVWMVGPHHPQRGALMDLLYCHDPVYCACVCLCVCVDGGPHSVQSLMRDLASGSSGWFSL